MKSEIKVKPLQWMPQKRTLSITRDCYKQLYANKLDNPQEMSKLLEAHSLRRLNWEAREAEQIDSK